MIYTIYKLICGVLLVLLFFMCIKTLRSRPSTVTTHMIMYLFSVFVANTAYIIELNTRSLDVFCAVTKIEYCCWALQNVLVLWLVANFAKAQVPKWFYGLEIGVSIGMLVAVTSMELHSAYALKIEVVDRGSFTQFIVTPGWYYIFYYTNVALIALLAIYLCGMKARDSKGIARKRAIWLTAGFAASAFAGIVMVSGLSRGYDTYILNAFAVVMCFYIAYMKYGYFDSVQTGIEKSVDHIQEGFAVLSPEGVVLYMNKQMRAIIPDIALGENVSDTVQFHDVFIMGKDEITIRGRTFEAHYNEINEFDSLIGYTIWFIDMTSYYSHYEEMRKLSEKAEQANEAKSHFLASMSHEIRTPLNAILGMDELIMRESRSSSITKYASNIYSAGKTLLSIINDILDISKIESGKVELVNAEYSLAETICSVYNMTKIKATKKGLLYHWNIDPAIPSILIGDKLRMRQVFINIINNATKYTTVGGVEMTLSCQRISRDTINVILSVKDTGVGIREEDKAKLFERFVRFNVDNNEHIEGTGLGLSIVKQIVDLMHGRIDVTSKVGRGSEFIITIPQKYAYDVPIGTLDDILTSDVHTPDKKDAHILTRNADILVVDDNLINLDVITGFLKPTRIRVHTLDNGYEAVEVLEKRRFDMIFLDQMMPGMSGIETLGNMHDRDLLKGTPVIALTADAVAGARERFIGCGFNDYLSKPVKSAELEEMIVAYLPPEKLIKPDDEMEKSDNATVIAISDSGETLNELRDELSGEYKVVCVKSAEQAQKYLSRITASERQSDES